MPSRLSPPLPRLVRALAAPAFLALVLVLAACGAASAPPPEVGAGGVALVPGATVSATVGPEGSELTTADPDGGRSYRLTVPAGAFGQPTDVTISPIGAIEGFPMDQLLGGVELAPEGAVFLAPVTLEITLDADGQAALRSALDEGQVVAGFSYPGGTTSAAADLGVTLAEVADDASSITLTLTSFSGHGAGTGNPGSLRGRPCPTDPVRHAECEIHKILHPQGGPADPADPAVRAQIAQVLRDWLDVLEVVIADSTGDPETFIAALTEALNWNLIAARYDLVSQIWWAPGDELEDEGFRLEFAVLAGWDAAFIRANEFCRTTARPNTAGGQDLSRVLTLAEIRERAKLLGLKPPALDAMTALAPGAFCAQLTLTASSTNPTALVESETRVFTFTLDDTSGAFRTEGELLALGARIAVTPAGPEISVAPPSWFGFAPQADVTAVRAIPGNDAEGRFVIAIRLFGSQADYASETVTFDVGQQAPTPPPTIRCSGDPATLTSVNNGKPDNIGIRFDGVVCGISRDLSGDDDADVVLSLDVDPYDSGWDADTGDNWSRDRFDDDEAPGSWSVGIEQRSSGTRFVLTFTVEITSLNSGRDVTLTVRDVTITPA